MSEEAPRTFRRESRLFLWVALLLILLLNHAMLLFFRSAVEWASLNTERRAGEILRRIALAEGEPLEAMDRVAVEPDVLFLAAYDERGRRVRSKDPALEAPSTLPLMPPGPGRQVSEWRQRPAMLLSAIASPHRVFVVALDPGPGASLRVYARTLSVIIPVAGAALVVLAWFYLRSLLQPYDRLLAAAGAAPGAAPLKNADERDFVIARFEATIAALSEKERELERLARAEKGRADDLETSARTLSRNLPTGLLSVDPGGTVVELNESGREILMAPASPRGLRVEALLADAPDFRDVIEVVRGERTPVGRREVHWRRGDLEKVLGVTVTPAAGADDRFLGVMALFTDLTEVRRLEARVALARHLADLGEVSAGAAHEFRNSAAAIDGFADLALRQPERASEHLQSIRMEAQQISRITSDFLLFARPGGFAPEPVNLGEAAEAATRETESAFPGVAVSRSGEFPELPGSPVLLRRALANLLRNAVEATPPERRAGLDAVVLEGRVDAGDVAVSVGDRGPGIAPGQREKIFLPFYSTKEGGAGLGLAIVARIAELHGGTVEVDDRPGGGALFTLRLSASGRPSPQSPS
ncbi:MAG TPA: ATP-binding protein [Thermoanaerobaculia bacterium]|nr:ATP-binding protein [Thermoanaerobaculia bacterium]